MENWRLEVGNHRMVRTPRSGRGRRALERSVIRAPAHRDQADAGPLLSCSVCTRTVHMTGASSSTMHGQRWRRSCLAPTPGEVPSELSVREEYTVLTKTAHSSRGSFKKSSPPLRTAASYLPERRPWWWRDDAQSNGARHVLGCTTTSVGPVQRRAQRGNPRAFRTARLTRRRLAASRFLLGRVPLRVRALV